MSGNFSGERAVNGNYSLLPDGSFVIKNYNQTPPFSNFLPGIAGPWGVPMWVFYVNRGQGVVSFGIEDKEHSILEFLPANKAYWLVSSAGFRTFLKIDGRDCYEPFKVSCPDNREDKMIVRSHCLEIQKVNLDKGLEFTVGYNTLPNSIVGGLLRKVKIKNVSNKKVHLQIIDGLARITPFGAGDFFLKNMSRTLEAWMHAFVFDNLSIFRLKVDPADVSETKYIEGANFNYSFYEQGGKKVSPYLIVDPQAVFDYDSSYSVPVSFFSDSFKTPLSQVTCGKTPCAFSYFTWDLAPEEEKVFYSVFGASFKQELIQKFVSSLTADSMAEKEEENKKIVEDIKSNVLCVSGKKEFDHYLGASYLDNVLRGGYPYKFDGKDIYYIYSRKHGDLERDYNRFKLLPSYFSEGEANYRDINQNRRMDLFFNPVIERKNIIYFLSLIRMDGYNPLIVKGEKLFFKREEAENILKEAKIKNVKLLDLMTTGFYLGEFFKFLKEQNIAVADKESLARKLVEKAGREPNASFGEGFWIDHWTYNLDLIDSFLYFYPEKSGDLFLSREINCWDDSFRVKERKYRYQLGAKGVFQGESIEENKEKKSIVDKRGRFKHYLRTKRGKIYKTTLVEKLLILILNKLASLDPYGIGVEMEAGKPGWCDSLNGLPAWFGSSLCETIELKRACNLLLAGINGLKEKNKEKNTEQVALAAEVFLFFNRLDKLLKDYFSGTGAKKDYLWWDKSNSIKEEFRRQTFFSIAGRDKELKVSRLKQFLQQAVKKLNAGIDKAKDKSSGVYFTYFTYQVKKHAVKNKRVFPLEFKSCPLPLFLEGPMHALKVQGSKEQYLALRKTELYDRELKMYRLNVSLADQPLEIGRSRIFVPGWLENESIWLHMEYKYLLEILKNGFYEEFFQDFYNCCVCFFDPVKYGRNILENSSFIVSSVYPDKQLWGRGFVARLSGATAELLNIWILLVLGKKPFFIDEQGNLTMKFSPVLEGKMFTVNEEKIKVNGEEVIIEKNAFAFKLFSSILVVYHNPKRQDTFRGDCRIQKIVLEKEGKKYSFESEIIPFPDSQAVRDVKVSRIDVYFEKV